jgi:hypothetical protein
VCTRQFDHGPHADGPGLQSAYQAATAAVALRLPGHVRDSLLCQVHLREDFVVQREFPGCASKSFLWELQLTSQEQSIKFFPIEPVRSPPNKRESFARRLHQFSPSNALSSQQGGLFKNSPGPRSSSSATPPHVSIDGRLPDPAIVTCNEPVPLRVLVKKLNDSDQVIFLGSIQLMLIAYTRIRAHDLSRVEQNSWVITSKANLRIPLGGPDVPKGQDMEVDKSVWAALPLPNAVCPSFETCNVSRKYELKVSVGLMWGSQGDIKVCCNRPSSIHANSSSPK